MDAASLASVAGAPPALGYAALAAAAVRPLAAVAAHVEQ